MDDADDKAKALAYQALSVFSIKYDPAKDTEVTDYFSSYEIQKIVFDHTGIMIDLTELHNLMIEMRYNYELQGDGFMWKCARL